MTTKAELQAKYKKLQSDVARFVEALDKAAIENDLCDEWFNVLEEATADTEIKLPVRQYTVSGSVSFDFSFSTKAKSHDDAIESTQEELGEAIEKAFDEIKLGNFEAIGLDIDAYEVDVE